jgi:hypothetical protein
MGEDVSFCHFTHQPVRTSIIFSFLSLFVTTHITFPSYSKGKGKGKGQFHLRVGQAQRGVEKWRYSFFNLGARW